MPTTKQDKDFATLIDSLVDIPRTTLDDAIGWMRDNLEPEDIFSETQLEKWALANGYVKGGDNE